MDKFDFLRRRARRQAVLKIASLVLFPIAAGAVCIVAFGEEVVDGKVASHPPDRWYWIAGGAVLLFGLSLLATRRHGVGSVCPHCEGTKLLRVAPPAHVSFGLSAAGFALVAALYKFAVKSVLPREIGAFVSALAGGVLLFVLLARTAPEVHCLDCGFAQEVREFEQEHPAK